LCSEIRGPGGDVKGVEGKEEDSGLRERVKTKENTQGRYSERTSLSPLREILKRNSQKQYLKESFTTNPD